MNVKDEYPGFDKEYPNSKLGARIRSIKGEIEYLESSLSTRNLYPPRLNKLMDELIVINDCLLRLEDTHIEKNKIRKVINGAFGFNLLFDPTITECHYQSKLRKSHFMIAKKLFERLEL